MDKILVKHLLEGLSSKLNCSGRILANLLGLNKNTLSNNANKLLEELTPSTQKKIVSLYVLVNEILPAHDPEAILRILNAHVFKSYSGETDSAISAIQQNKYELDTLKHIVVTAKNQHEDRLRKESLVDLRYVEQTLLHA